MKEILILGCGGVGGVTAARLSAAGHRVTAVTSNPEIAAAINKNGLVARYEDAIHTARFAAVARLQSETNRGPFDLCVLAVPPNAVRDALEDALPYLAPDAPIVCLPNGLVEEHVSKLVDPQRVIGGIVEFGARMLGPGRVLQTAPGGITIGRLPAAHTAGADPALERVAEVLSGVGPVHRARNLRGARWSKLAINCAISSLGTIGGDRLGVLMRHRFVRRLALETMSEVVEVARACGVELEKVAGTLDLEWLALGADERLKSGSASLLAKHTVLLVVGTKFRNMRSSMLAAIERGRKPPVDYLNGEVVARGERHGVLTPVNRALLETVHAIADGQESSSLATLESVYDATRERLRELEMAG